MSELGLPSESDQGPCGDSDIDVEDLLPSASKCKFQGSGTYSTKFDSRWKEQYPWPALKQSREIPIPFCVML